MQSLKTAETQPGYPLMGGKDKNYFTGIGKSVCVLTPQVERSIAAPDSRHPDFPTNYKGIGILDLCQTMANVGVASFVKVDTLLYVDKVFLPSGRITISFLKYNYLS